MICDECEETVPIVHC